VVACQHAEPAGIDRERFVQSELHRKVCDGIAVEFGMCCLGPGQAGEVFVELFEVIIVQLQIVPVLGESGRALTADFTQKTDRVVPKPFPQVVIEFAEDVGGFRLPGPPKVECQFAKTRNAFSADRIFVRGLF